MSPRTYVGLILVAAMCACSNAPGTAQINSYPPGEFDTDEKARLWASSSAPGIFTSAVAVLSLSSVGGTSGCPSSSISNGMQTYTGGCTDSQGRTWTGSASVTSMSTTTVNPSGMMVSGSANISYNRFGFTGTETCNGMSFPTSLEANGSLEYGGSNTQGIDFSINMALVGSGVDNSNCTAEDDSVAWEYSGSIASGPDTNNDGQPDSQTWNGSGRVGSGQFGAVDARTDNELINSNTCSSEATSGSTTVSAAGNTAVFTYDGASDCDTTSTITWTYNGASRGELTGVRCSIARPGEQPRGRFSGLVGIALALAALTYRRARR